MCNKESLRAVLHVIARNMCSHSACNNPNPSPHSSGFEFFLMTKLYMCFDSAWFVTCTRTPFMHAYPGREQTHETLYVCIIYVCACVCARAPLVHAHDSRACAYRAGNKRTRSLKSSSRVSSGRFPQVDLCGLKRTRTC